MTKKNKRSSLSLPLARALKKFGSDLCDARRRRRLSVSIMAERASISRMTLNKIEKGDPGVSFGSYAKVLFVLGLSDRLSDLIDVQRDKFGLELLDEDLPKRIRKPKPKNSKLKKGKK
ncbi:MAG: hypothetical protein R3A13_05465 [Bdellovibrionota bacterium]